MAKSTKKWFLTGMVLAIAGCLIFGGVMMALKWDFSKLATDKYETNTYQIHETYRNIQIETDTADISFVPSENSSVTCYTQKTEKHSVRVEGDTLIVEQVISKKWYDYIGIHFDTPKITLFIPQGAYGALTVKRSTGNLEIPQPYSFESMDITGSTGNVNSFADVSGAVKIQASTGDISLANLSAAGLDMSVTTGKITVKDVTCAGDVKILVTTGKTALTDLTCKNLMSDGNTGKISLENVIAEGKITMERSTGDVTLSHCDAEQIRIKTDTGDVIGSLLSNKIFFTETDTGRINVPRSLTGGSCEISTDTGDIQFKILP